MNIKWRIHAGPFSWLVHPCPPNSMKENFEQPTSAIYIRKSRYTQLHSSKSSSNYLIFLVLILNVFKFHSFFYVNHKGKIRLDHTHMVLRLVFFFTVFLFWNYGGVIYCVFIGWKRKKPTIFKEIFFFLAKSFVWTFIYVYF